MPRYNDLESGFEKYLALAYGKHIITAYQVLHSIGLETGGTGKEVVILQALGDGAYNELGEGAWQGPVISLGGGECEFGNTILAETFNRPDGSLGTAPNAEAWIHVGTEEWEIEGNEAKAGGAGLAVIETGESDGEVEITIRNLAPFAGALLQTYGVAFRLVDEDNYWYCVFRSAGGGSLALYAIVAGGGGPSTGFGVNFDLITPALGDKLRVTFCGDQIDCYWNDVHKVTHSSSHAASGTKHGLKTQVADAQVDDFTVRGGGFGITAGASANLRVLYAGFDIPIETNVHYHPGIISRGDNDPIQGVDTWFPGGSTYSATPNIAVLLPEGIAEDADGSKLAVLVETSIVADYDEDGNLIAIGYSANPARVKADMLKRDNNQHLRINWPSYVHARDWYDRLLDWEAGDTTHTYTSFTGVPTYDKFGNLTINDLTGAGGKTTPTQGNDNKAVTKERILANTNGHFKIVISGAFPTGTGGGSMYLVDSTGFVWFGISWGNGHLGIFANGVDYEKKTEPYDFPAAAGNSIQLECLAGNFVLKQNGVVKVIPQGPALVPDDTDLFGHVSFWAPNAGMSSSEIAGKRVNETTQNITEVTAFEAHPAFTGPIDIGTALDYVDFLCASDTQDAGHEIIFLTPEPRTSQHVFDEEINVVGKTVRAYPTDIRDRPNRLWAKFRNLDLQFFDQDSVFDLRDELFQRVGRPIDPGALNFASMSAAQAQRLIKFYMRRRSDNYRWCDLTGMLDSFKLLPADVCTVLSKKYKVFVDGGYDDAATEIELRADEVANFRLGTYQVETATVVGTITGAGDVQAVVTAAGLTGSPRTVDVPVLVDDTAAIVAGKIRDALAADGPIDAFFNIGGAASLIVLTKRSPSNNDAALNIALNTGTAAGLTDAPNSQHTLAGRGVVPFFATWWNASDYKNPREDPNREVIQVNSIINDTFGDIVRGQQGTVAADHNIAGKTYVIGRIPKDFVIITAGRANLAKSTLERPFKLQEYYPDDYRDNDHGPQQPPVGTPPPSPFSCPPTPVLVVDQVSVEGVGGIVTKILGTVHFGVYAYSQSVKIYITKGTDPEIYTGLVVEPASGTTTGNFEYIAGQPDDYIVRAEVFSGSGTVCGSATAPLTLQELLMNPTNDALLINPATGEFLLGD